MAEPVFQSALGTVQKSSTNNERNWKRGYLAVGTVTKVHHKRYTADVTLYDSGDNLSSLSNQEGKHSCRILSSYAGYSKKYEAPYGASISIEPGNKVLVGFAENTYSRPFILGVLHDITEDNGDSNYNNMLPTEYPIKQENEKEYYRSTIITRTQDFMTIDGLGQFQIGSHTKAFIAGTREEIDEEDFGYKDLDIKRKAAEAGGGGEKETITLQEDFSKPFKFVIGCNSKYDTEKADQLRVIVDPVKSSFRMTKVQTEADKRTELFLEEDGTFTFKRQTDTAKREGSSKYTAISTNAEGIVTVDVAGDTPTKIVVSPDGGITVDTKKGIKVTSKESISIDTQASINMSAKGNIIMRGSRVLIN